MNKVKNQGYTEKGVEGMWKELKEKMHEHMCKRDVIGINEDNKKTKWWDEECRKQKRKCKKAYSWKKGKIGTEKI